MPKFLSRFSLFAIFVIVFLWIVLCLYDQTKRQMLYLPEGRHIVFFGASHIETSINDSIVLGAFNFGRSGERLEWIYAKVRMLKDINPQLDTIVIGLDNVLPFHGVDELDVEAPLFHPYNLLAYDVEDHLYLTSHTTFAYITASISHPLGWLKIFDLRHYMTGTPTAFSCRYLGGYLWLVRDKLEEAKKRGAGPKKEDGEISDFNLHFLQKTIDYCKQNGIEVLFLCPPQHPDCPLTISYRKIYKEHFSDIPFYDCLDMQFPDSCWGDLNHLNYRGARPFSEYVDREILKHQ